MQVYQKAAEAWLMGKGCTFRVVSIAASMMDAGHNISAELDRPSGGEGFEEGLGGSVSKGTDHPPEEELPQKAGPAESAPALDGNDTRF